MDKHGTGRGETARPGRRATGHPVISDAVVVRGLRRFARMRGGRAFTMKEFDAWTGRPCCSMTAVARVGSWGEVLKRAGMKRGVRRGEYSSEELVAEYERVWKKIGRRPGNWALTRHSKFSIDPYRRRWGSVRRLGEMVEAMRAGKASRAEVLRADARRERPRRIRPGTRYAVLKRDQYRCVACGRSPANELGLELEVDHIVPASRGGGDGMENLRTLCGACNLGKAAFSPSGE